MDFLASTDVGKIVPAVEEDTESEVSEWELRERTERDVERRAEEFDAEGGREAGE